jgi:hypothetical protein
MKKKLFITLFVSTQLLFVVMQIHQHSSFIKHSYSKQKYESQKSDLLHKKQAQTHELYALQNKAEIKQYARRVLHMEPLKLNQIKNLPHDQSV